MRKKKKLTNKTNIIMKNLKNKFILASAILALASCADNSYLGEQEEKTGAGGAISFGFDVPTPTRASGADAATALDNQFIVYAEKGDITAVAPTAGNLVFPNYQVNWTDNTANTTTSNTNNWEYVGYTHSTNYQNNITTLATSGGTAEKASSAAQTIKYWDNNASNYVFTAVSAKKEDIENGRVKIQKNEYGTSAYNKGYTITLAKDANSNYPTLSNLYFSDRNVIEKGTNGYNHNVVQMNFRNALSKVRVGIYETIPGYRISAITFYEQDGTTKYTDGASTPTDAFGAVCPNHNPSKFEGTLTVTYADNNSGHENQPIVSLSGATAATDLVLGTNFSTLTTTGEESNHKYLGETSTTATFDTADGSDTDTEPDYTAVMPQTATSPLKLKVNYTLYNTVTKETINITGKTAEVPAKYLDWKANYKYTYLFKITDDDLNPITFDAVVTEDAVGNAEYITTVTEPSITTFGVIVNSSDAFKNYVTEKNEYQIPTTASTDKLDIYATFMQGVNVLTPQLTSSDKANYVTVYFVDYKTGATEAEKAEKPITELSVANAIEHTGGLITATAIQNENNIYFANDAGDVPAPVTSVPAEDGTTKTINAVKLPGVITAGKYAVEIVTYEKVTLSSGDNLSGYYSVDNDGKFTKQTTGTYSSGDYYKQTKTYKVITVVSGS